MKMLRKSFQKILSLTLMPLLKRYLAKPRKYRYKEIMLTIPPGVFHPEFFFSTQFFLNYLKALSLKGKTVLELGAGNGLISFYANSKGAIVTASDISQTAVENLKQNQLTNAANFNVVLSDLFVHIPLQQFDFILINPPYYKKKPVSEADYAWYCGENMEYFIRLFEALNKFISTKSIVLMVLSEDCAIAEIQEIAQQNNFQFKKVAQKRIWLELNFIFEISRIIK